MTTQHLIRNFCIIAHVDHGKSTLADRMIELTGAVSERELVEQHLDTMDLERERGITIKAQAVRLRFPSKDGNEYQLNLIDTPGHVDFSYEVSRSLAACEAAVLLIDASQGIQAQTMANVYLALENDLVIIPAINKIDMPNAEPERVASEMVDTFGFSKDEMLWVSGKTGEGVEELLERIIELTPPPVGELDQPLQALVFDSKYDSFKGVVAYVRVLDGQIKARDRAKFMDSGSNGEVLEVGYFSPTVMRAPEGLRVGEVGYVATGIKDVGDVMVGDTMTLVKEAAIEPRVQYQEQKPMVFTGLYPSDANDYGELREALGKLRLNDAALVFEPESSSALGFGFRCGFLGLLHMEVVQERLEREYELELITTAPSVEFQVMLNDGEIIYVENPSKLPDKKDYAEILEPWVDLSIIVPAAYYGNVMELVTQKRGVFKRMEYLQTQAAGSGNGTMSGSMNGAGRNARVMLEYEAPLSAILVDFHDMLKSATQGYASMDYQTSGYREANMVKLDILVNHEEVDALSSIVHSSEAADTGRKLASKLKDLIPRQMFAVPIQAAIGGKIVARTNVKALRKNVLAKCYGGDVTRKRKLLERQKEGKRRRAKMVGSVEVPQEAFMAVLQLRN
ncbi:MAG: elongation factor 4 [Chloroflexi bacterium]|nr:elongation factor 4 [Chloroflexota bacterium]MYK62081.1 elongation factor 4 [Chloroflexota bacterium]